MGKGGKTDVGGWLGAILTPVNGELAPVSADRRPLCVFGVGGVESNEAIFDVGCFRWLVGVGCL